MIEINHDRCIQCVGCASVCPVLAIELVGLRMKTYPEKCISCKACALTTKIMESLTAGKP